MDSETEGASRPPEKRRRLYYCGHCEDFVTKPTFYRHRRRFYSYEDQTWKSENHRQGQLPAGESSDDASDDSWSDDLIVTSESGDKGASYPDDSPCGQDPVSSEPSVSSSESENESEEAEDDFNLEDWTEEEDTSSSEAPENEESQQSPSRVKHLLLFLVIWQFVFKVSNAAVTSLLRFLKYYVCIIGHVFNCQHIREMGQAIPLSLRTVYTAVSLEDDTFIKYVVCPACDSVYDYNDCFTVSVRGVEESKRCKHVAYPNHPQQSHRKPCDTLLLKKVRTKKGYTLQPIKTYAYQPLKKSMQQLVQSKSFIESCEKWRSRVVPEDYFCDIYDGYIWQSFGQNGEHNFLTVPHCYLLTLNVDWFEPFERGVYSVGAIYLTVQNLPRNERYKPHNIIIVGIIPGPKEPKKTINSYLTPLVLELKEAWLNGFQLTSWCNTALCVKLALSCVSCDIPAGRKVCGFLSHNAALGCTRCLKVFPVKVGEKTDCSGYDRENWSLRSCQQHNAAIKNVLKQVTKTGIRKAEKENGVRYSVLSALPYFDAVKFTAIDAMHNLFLGTAKHVFNTWIENGVLTKKVLKAVERKVNLFRVPGDIGRLPSNISSCYGAFTANQWKNWITIYSPVVLKDVLPADHLRCWLLFVRGCCILSSWCIKKTDLDSADGYLLNFCRQFEILYGGNNCTMNMHLHAHLKQIFYDYGPPHATWCYAFERFNGILGSYHTNRKSIEVQIMRRFCQDQAVHRIDIPSDAEYRSVLPAPFQSKVSSYKESLSLLHLARSKLNLIETFALTDSQSISVLPPIYELALHHTDLQWLRLIYEQLYPQHSIIHFSPFYRRFGRVVIAGDVIGSDQPGPNSSSSSVVMAFWPSRGDNLANIDYRWMSVGVVQYFIFHTVSYRVGDRILKDEHVFAYVKWKQTHPHFGWYGASATVCINMYELSGACSFIPVQRIATRCAHAVFSVNFSDIVETVFVACPIPLKYSV